MREQVIHQHGNLRRILDRRADRLWTFVAILGLNRRIGRQLRARVHRKGDAIVTGMINRLGPFEVQFLPTLDFRNSIGHGPCVG
jgi:hypothetical protein